MPMTIMPGSAPTRAERKSSCVAACPVTQVSAGGLSARTAATALSAEADDAEPSRLR